ncbi:MAG: GNAT family N-acetyltransferase [Victivallales bacterium]
MKDSSAKRSRNSKEKQLAAHLKHHPGCFYVAERGGKIVGFITFYCDAERKVGIISNNAVDPFCGEKGVGQEMYRAALEYFRKAGMLLAQVTTGLDEAHAPARRAYERAGFDLHTEAVTYTMKLGKE